MTKSADPGGANGEAGVKKGKIAFASVDSLVETKCALKVSPEPPKRPPPATPGLFLRGGGGERRGERGVVWEGRRGELSPLKRRCVLCWMRRGWRGGDGGALQPSGGWHGFPNPTFLSPPSPPPFSR